MFSLQKVEIPEKKVCQNFVRQGIFNTVVTAIQSPTATQGRFLLNEIVVKSYKEGIRGADYDEARQTTINPKLEAVKN